MNRREELDDILRTFCPNVYFQPPQSVKMVYPCIVYGLSSINSQYADNKPYLHHTAYSLRYIHKDPDDPLVYGLLVLPTIKHTNRGCKDNLYQDSYTIFY